MLAARHRARLAMEEGSRDNHEERPAQRNVRRRLFVDEEDDNENNGEVTKSQLGKVDNETNSFIEETRKDMNNAKERWNFDFEKEQPLPGRYEWVKVNENFSDDIPNENLSINKDIPGDIPNGTKKSEIDIKSSKED